MYYNDLLLGTLRFINQYKYVIIRGTGIRAKRLMEEIESWQSIAPALYYEVRRKLRCFVDNAVDKQGTTFFGVSVITPEGILRNDSSASFQGIGPTLYVLAVADYRSIIEEIEKENNSQIRVITDKAFLLKMHRMMAADGYKSYNEEDAFAVREVKALFFLHGDEVLKRKETIGISLNKCVATSANHATIALFTGIYGVGGAERVVSRLAEILAAKRHKIIIIADCQAEHEYALPEGVQCVYSQHSYNESFNAWVDERYKLLKKYKVQIACFHIPYDGPRLFYEVLLCKRMGIRTIVEYHTSFINAFNQRGGLAENRTTYIFADKLVVVSKTDEVYWRDNGVDAVYIPNPFPKEFDSSGNEYVEKENNCLLWIGRIDHKYKRVFDLIPIMQEVRKSVPDVKLYMIGAAPDPDEGKRFANQIKENSLDQNIELCGFQDDVDTYYKKASLMLMTSPGEGFPMTLAEAKSHGLPVVMYDLPYLELVKDGKGVVKIEQGNMKTFAHEVTALLKDENKREKLSKEAKESAKFFHAYDIADAWEKVFMDKCMHETDKEAEAKERRLIGLMLGTGLQKEIVQSHIRHFEELHGIYPGDGHAYNAEMIEKAWAEEPLNLEERTRLQEKYHFVNWHLTLKKNKPYMEAILRGILALANDDDSIKEILEIGCGLGDIIADPLLNIFNRTAYDISSEVIGADREWYKGRGIEWNVGVFNDVRDRKIDCLIMVNFIHSVKPEYLKEYFPNLFFRNHIRYMFVDQVTGNYPYTHDFEQLLPEGVREIYRFGPYDSDGGHRYILIFENRNYNHEDIDGNIGITGEVQEV